MGRENVAVLYAIVGKASNVLQQYLHELKVYSQLAILSPEILHYNH